MARCMIGSGETGHDFTKGPTTIHGRSILFPTSFSVQCLSITHLHRRFHGNLRSVKYSFSRVPGILDDLIEQE